MRSKTARIWMIFLVLIWIFFFLGAGTISILSYPIVRALADRVSMDGNANRFTLDFFNQIQGQAHWIIVLLAPIGIVLFIFRKKVEKFLSEKIPPLSSLGILIDIPALSRMEVIWLLILTGAGFSFRLIHMQGIVTYDEAFTYFQYAQNPLMAVTVYTHVNNHIFHTLLLSLVTSIFGDSYWVLRSIAIVTGTLLIPLSFLTVRSLRLGSPALNGWLTAVVVSFDPLIVHYSAIARGYTLQALIVLLTWIIFVQIYQGRRDLVFVLGLLCALALWTIPTSSYLLVGLGFAFLGSLFQHRIKMSDLLFFIIITGIVTALLWSPAVLTSGLKAVIMNPDVNPVAAGMAVDPLPERFKYIWEPLSLHLGGMGGFGLVFLLTLWGLYAAPSAWRRIGLGIFTSIFILTAFFQVTPPPRTWVFLVPLISILVDFGICKILQASRSIIKLSGLIVGALAIVYTLLVLPHSLKYEGPGHAEVTAFARAVADQWVPGQAIEIQAEKTRLLQSDPENFYTFYDWYNSYTVKYYLERQGISTSAFRWREKNLSPTVWLISVQVDGKPIDLQGSEGKRVHWDLIMGPYSLAKQVDKSQFSN